ncbi:catalase 3 precursor [Annulohypoxylon truncatum]|uniref:catalase 3 precursor n=1 Tax=Annulohypoxylon truncatum TaxID=327061 RepID=UPI002008A4D8|nr:catalase 3 precursor [Annulohypoxylon truncatum]KAI1212919.1 catalase 3 precursor [Annulohypoxylon truncatum]
MGRILTHATLLGLLGLVSAGCPFADPSGLHARADGGDTDPVLGAMVDDSNGYFTDDVGGQIQEQDSLRAGERGPTLLEDFIFRQKIQHFDHERVPERAVHARGAGAHGTFTSYGDWSNLTAASFLGTAGKETPVFVRFSTVAGSRGSADTARDVHGFATRFYTDEGNFDIVGNNIPVFFIQDAIRFPDLIHSVKPSPDSEIPQAATAHDSAWDFFSQQPSTLHTLFWAMAGFGIPRSFRHMDGFGVHTFRLVKDDGTSKLVKWHWKTKQGKASLYWEEAQILSGKNADAHRQDLFEAIEAGNGPEWELAVQVVDEDQALAFGFDLLDPTKILPEEYAPLQKLGVMKLHTNPTNYFAETEQIMFQPGHIVRGVDFTEDPLLQGRIFSYLDTQLNRHGGPNFEQLPINRPVVPIHNNNRDGAGQNLIHKNIHAYSPNSLNDGYPQQATQSNGRGFFSAPIRSTTGKLVRGLSSTFDDHWSQPRLFYNSLTPVEQQFLINAIRFETSHLTSTTVKQNVLTQLNKISNDIAVRVATALALEAPAPDDTYYHDNTTAGISITNVTLPTVATLKVGILASTSKANGTSALDQAQTLKTRLASENLTATVVAESLVAGVDKTYSAADATDFDAVIVTSGADAAGLFALTAAGSINPLYPPLRPLQIANAAYLFGKPVAYFGGAAPSNPLVAGGFDPQVDGVYASADVDTLASGLVDGLKTYKFTGRYPVDKTT